MGQKEITQYTTSGGARVYCMPIQTFPGHFTNVYLVLAGDVITLIDITSGWGESDADLVKALEEVGERFGEKVTLDAIDLLLITHGHIDHFGGLSFFRAHSHAKVGIHRLDTRQIINLEETVMVVAHNIRLFLETVGISEGTRKGLMSMYRASKDFAASTPVDFSLIEGEDPIAGIFEVLHTPGHCPGHVCIRLDNVLFAGDHLLSDISPHQSPEAIAPYTGLGHYLASLKKIKATPGIDLAFGGHQRVMEDPYGRIEAIEAGHAERLDRVLEICKERRTIKEISSLLFDTLSGYQVLLGLEEAAAHVEYLSQRGILAIDNLADLEREVNPVLYYKTR